LRIKSTINEIKEELMLYGPSLMGLTIYEDFYNYASGVYSHVSGTAIG
jgi:hypothetical protein